MYSQSAVAALAQNELPKHASLIESILRAGPPAIHTEGSVNTDGLACDV